MLSQCRIGNVANVAYYATDLTLWGRARGTPLKIFYGTPGYFHVR